MPKPAASESLTSRPPTAYAADGRSGGPVFECSDSSGAELERPSAHALSGPAAQSALPDPKGSRHVSRSQVSLLTSTGFDVHLNHSLWQGGVAQGHSLRCGHAGSVSTSGQVWSSRYRSASTNNSAARSRMSARSRS